MKIKWESQLFGIINLYWRKKLKKILPFKVRGEYLFSLWKKERNQVNLSFFIDASHLLFIYFLKNIIIIILLF
jgi:hypothetical protein